MEGSRWVVYLLLIHLFSPFSFVLVERQSEFQSISEASKFRVNYLSIVYHCATVKADSPISCCNHHTFFSQSRKSAIHNFRPNYYPPHPQPTSEKNGCLAYRGCQLAPNSLPTRPTIRISPGRADTLLHPTFLPCLPSSKPRTYRTTRHALLSYPGVGRCRTPAIPRCEVIHKGH